MQYIVPDCSMKVLVLNYQPLCNILSQLFLNWPNRQDLGLTSKDFASLMEQVIQFNRVGTVREKSGKIRFYSMPSYRECNFVLEI